MFSSIPKKNYKEANDFSITDVKISMYIDEEAQKDLLCNGFSIDVKKVARAGGMEQFSQSIRPRVYNK